MALAAFHRGMRPRQHEFGLRVALARKCRWLKTILRVAAIAFTEVRRFCEFAGVRIGVAIVAEKLFRHVERAFALGLMTLGALERCMLSFQLECTLLMRLSCE